MNRIPVAGPWITDLEIAYVAEAARTNWYEHAGDFVSRFERRFADHVERRHAVALPSCTSAIHLALVALGIGPGDEVIVPEVTWIASAAPISYVGASPVFADVDRSTWCMGVDAAASCLTDRTRAIIAVDLYGSTPDLGALEELAASRGIALVEDAAEAIGARRADRPAGAFGVASTFSFHGSKTLTTGEGGMLVTDDDALHARVLVLRDHGRAPGDTRFRNGEVAFKYTMTSMQAALGLGQLERVDELVDRKRRIFHWYEDRLAGAEGIALDVEPAGTTHAHWMVTALFDRGLAVDKHALGSALAARGVDTRPMFDPLSSLPAYADLDVARGASTRNPIAYDVSPRGLNLPSALALEEKDVDEVCRILRAVLATG